MILTNTIYCKKLRPQESGISCGERRKYYMKLVQNYRADGKIPTDDEINQCIEIANREDCIVHLEWVFPYSGRYSVDIVKGMAYEAVKNKLPKCYPV